MVKKNWVFKLAILSFSTVLMAGPAIAGAIPSMAESFSHLSSTAIESISTIPNLGIIIFVMLSSLVTRVIGDKKTILLGLTISLFAGLVPVITTNFTAIVVSRFIFGAGVGLLNPLAYSIISYFFDGDERAKMLGFQGSLSSVGGAILTLGAGTLVQQSWQASFLVYLIIIPVIVLVFLKVPEMNVGKVETKKEIAEAPIVSSETKQGLDIRIFGYAFYLFLIFACFMTITIKLALLVISKGYGDATQASTIISLLSISGVIMGVLFGTIYKHLKRFILPLSVLLLGVSFFIISFSNSLLVTGIGILLTGCAFANINPYIFMKASELATPEQGTLTSSILLVGINLGVFFSPFFIGILGSALGYNSPAEAILICGVLLLGLGMINLVGSFRKPKEVKLVAE